ncbi:MAG: putative rRNA maturation factor [Porticoccus sp.]|jgi:probable rRNA maturation factor
MTAQLELQNDDQLRCPTLVDFELWSNATLAAINYNKLAAFTLRIASANEVQSLNAQYRNQDKPTNVLSFPADLPAELELPDIGDLIICAEIVEKEAVAQNKPLKSHWAHMTVHGILHLLGYDHLEDSEATKMEALETEIVTTLGFMAPYE